MSKAIFGVVGLVGLLFVPVAEGAAEGSPRVPPARIDASTRYVPEPDATKASAIATHMRSILTTAQCWHRRGSSDNYTFSGANDYRYAGYETTAGQIGLNSVGSFGGYDAADIVISHTQYWIGIYDAKTFAMSFVTGAGGSDSARAWSFTVRPS